METKINIADLVSHIKNWETWGVLIIVSIFGMLGGLAHKLTSPSEDKTSLWGYIVVGAVASLAVLFIFVPQDVVRLIALSVVAGYGGKAVLDALEARVKTAIAETKAARAEQERGTVMEVARIAVRQGLECSQTYEKLMAVVAQPRDVLETMKTSLPAKLRPEAFTKEFRELSVRLDTLEGLFQG